MTKIALFTEPTYAPCAYLIVRKRADGSYDPYSEADTVLVQTDTDFPGVARSFGSDVDDYDISDARDALDAMSNDARFTSDAALEVDDPGYFAEEPSK